MQLNNYLKSKMHFIGAFSILFGLASCGSYQYAGQNDDSIYGSTERTVEYHEEAVEESSPTQGSSYYENYFKEKSQELEINQDDDLYFTDIDAYEGGYDVENDSLNYQGGYTGWGQDNNDVTINVFGGHLFNSIYGNRPFYPSWINNYGFGYGNTYGYGYGYGYNSYWCPPYYGSIYAGWNSWNYGYPYYYGYRNRYYGNYYNHYNGYYSGRSLAYNSGRRGSIYNNSNLTGRTINKRSVANRSTTSRRSTATRNTNRSTSSDVNTAPRRTVRNTTTRPSNKTRTRPRTTTTRPRTTSTQPRTTTTRTRSSNNSSVNRSRSSSNVRSSNNSSRSTSRSSSSRSSSSRKKNN